MKEKRPMLTFPLRVANLRVLLLRYALKLTRDPEDAADLTQDALLLALKNEHNFEPGTNLPAWLRMLTRNLFCTQYQKKKRTFGLHLTDDPTLEHPSIFAYLDTKQAPATDFVGLLDDVNAALLAIDTKNRLPFLMHVEGYKYHEIATRCALPIGTIKSQIHRCRGLLRDQLAMYA